MIKDNKAHASLIKDNKQERHDETILQGNTRNEEEPEIKIPLLPPAISGIRFQMVEKASELMEGSVPFMANMVWKVDMYFCTARSNPLTVYW